MVDSLKHPRSDLVGQLNPGGGLAGTSACCSRTTSLAGCAALAAPVSPRLELACVEEGDDVLTIPAQPARTGSSVSSAATISAGRPAARGSIQLCARIRESPNQPISQLSALSASTGIPLAERLPGHAEPFP